MTEQISLIRKKSYEWLVKNYDSIPQEKKDFFTARSWARIGYIAGAVWASARINKLVNQAVLDLGKEDDISEV